MGAVSMSYTYRTWSHVACPNCFLSGHVKDVPWTRVSATWTHFKTLLKKIKGSNLKPISNSLIGVVVFRLFILSLDGLRKPPRDLDRGHLGAGCHQRSLTLVDGRRRLKGGG